MRTRKLVEHLTYRLIAVGLAAAIGILGCCDAWAKAPENDPDSRKSKVIYDSQVMAASYSTGQQGNRLKWMPYRPSKSLDSKSQEPKSLDVDSAAQESEAQPMDNKRVEAKRVMVRWADIEWSDTKSEGVRQVDFRDPPKPSLNISGDPLKNPFGDSRRPQKARAKLARLTGPNASGPLLRPVGNSNAAMPLPGLALESKQDARSIPRMLLNQPSGEEELAGDDRKITTIEEELARNPKAFMNKCPDRSSFKSINELNDNIAPKKNGKFPPECSLSHEVYRPRDWTPTTFAWTAPGTCHKPLYFEQVQVERYGHSWGPILQPLLSGAHFFVTVPILPYKMGTYPPGECMYSLGYYRPGSCAPFMLDPLPISVRGGLIQAGVVVGAAYIIP